MTGSPARAGLFAAVQAIAMLAAGLPAGSLADRFDPRAIVLVTEAGRVYAVRALAHAAPFVFTAASFALALATTAFLPRRERRQPRPDDRRRQSRVDGRRRQTRADDRQPDDQTSAADLARGGLLAGVRVLWGHPVLRAAMILIMVLNTLRAGLDLIVIVLLRHQTVSPTEIGLALGAGYAGGIAGIPVIRILHRLGPG
jgi:MFS family permease